MIGEYLSQTPSVACLWHAIPREVWVHAPPPPYPGKILKMHTLRDVFSLMLEAIQFNYSLFRIHEVQIPLAIEPTTCVM